MAVDLRFRIEYTPGPDPVFRIHTPDLPGSEPRMLDLRSDEPRSDDDYCWGVGRALVNEGFRFPRGGDVVFSSNIPFRAGCSSSSAMSAAWMRLLLEIGEHPEREAYIQDPEAVAYLVYKGEKEMFQGKGGMMDQYACYLGGLLYVYPATANAPRAAEAETTVLQRRLQISYGVERFPDNSFPNGFVLVDSGEPKDTQGVLGSVGDLARAAVEAATDAAPEFDLRMTTLADFDGMHQSGRFKKIDDEQLRIVRDHIINRDLCTEGRDMLRRTIAFDARRLGAMFNEEHRVLGETLGISTPRIDRLQHDCNAAGALGGKINGSGGGGTLFCFAPDARDRVCEMLDQRMAPRYVVRPAEGARIERDG